MSPRRWGSLKTKQWGQARQLCGPGMVVGTTFSRGGEGGAGAGEELSVGEFDPGSGRTLAACLMYASRAGEEASASSLAANG